MKAVCDYKIIDLSVPIDPDAWEPEPVKRKVVDHKKGADLLGRSLAYVKGDSWLSRMKERVKHRLGMGMDHRDFPDQKGLSLMSYTLTTHTGTHLDAPFHFGDLDNHGNPAKTVSQIPLEWCFNDGVLLDMTANNAQEAISEKELRQELSRLQYQVKPLDIVLIKTGADRFAGTQKYFSHYRGMSREATLFLLEYGVKIIGIDSFGFDAPFGTMVSQYLKTGNKDCLWPSHMLGRHREYCHIERLANLDRLPQACGFKVSCFPVSLKSADAAWCRAVAIFETKEK